MFRFLTAGETHGPCLTAILEGIPAGVEIDINAINADLKRRQKGVGRGGRMKIESDQVEIRSGVRFGVTLGGPITLVVQNKDWDNWQERMNIYEKKEVEAVTAPRPGHADLSGLIKYGRLDIRDVLERASARETAIRTAVGGVAKQVLRSVGIEILSHVVNVGGVWNRQRDINTEELAGAESMETGCYDSVIAEKMKFRIQQAQQCGETLGGVFEVIVRNAPIGLGSYVHWDRRLDSRIAAAMMSIPAIKGVEIGDGFSLGSQWGSEAHDAIFYDQKQGFYRKTNRAGGVEGGMTNGEPVIVRAAMKPIPTLMNPLESVDILTYQETKANTERSDACAVLAASVVGEAMMGIIMLEALVEKFGGDTLEDLKNNMAVYMDRVKRCIMPS